MALKFDYIKYLISKLNKVEYAKYYDYICNFKNGKYKIYRREYEGKPWVLYMKNRNISRLVEEWREKTL